MHRLLFGLTLLLLATTSFAADRPRARVESIDRILAVVNNEVITQFEFDARMRMAVHQLQQQNIPVPPRATMEKQLMERMIDERVQLQFAAETGIRVDDAMLDRAIERIAGSNNMRPEQFRQAIEKDGVPYSKFRNDIRNEITLGRLREREADAKVFVTDSEVDNYFASKSGDADTEFNVAHILIQVPDQASPEQLQQRRTRAEQALAELKKGTPFAQVSAIFSDAPNALQGGELGWRAASRLPQLFVDALHPLQPGEFSAVVRSPNGFHILKLVDKRGQNVPMVVTQTHARHILVKVSELVSDTDAQHRLADLKERLENGGDFAALAKLHSEDGSAPRGGDLGWLSPGDTVPDFERAMDALAPHVVSQPVRSPFGWHLIEVLERRKQDVGQEKARLKARTEIRERKADEAYDEFVRQLRDRAYIEYHTDDK